MFLFLLHNLIVFFFVFHSNAKYLMWLCLFCLLFRTHEYVTWMTWFGECVVAFLIQNRVESIYLSCSLFSWTRSYLLCRCIVNFGGGLIDWYFLFFHNTKVSLACSKYFGFLESGSSRLNTQSLSCLKLRSDIRILVGIRLERYNRYGTEEFDW